MEGSLSQAGKGIYFTGGAAVVPEDFVDYYNANGWHIGNQPVWDWKALARRWDRKEKENGKEKNDAGQCYEKILIGQVF